MSNKQMRKNSHGRSRYIPADVRRAVRRNCGFGCIVCGIPVYQYDHFETPWVDAKEHSADDIVLLCPTHHQQKTIGTLPMKKLRVQKTTPYNLEKGRTSAETLHYFGEPAPKIILGGNECAPGDSGDGAYAGLMIDGLWIVAFKIEDGHPLLTLCLFDPGNRHILLVVENELRHAVLPDNGYDIRYSGKHVRHLKINIQRYKLLVEIKFDTTNNLIEIFNGRILTNGIEIIVQKDHLFVVNTSSRIERTKFTPGIALGNIPESVKVSYRHGAIDRYPRNRTKLIADYRKERKASQALTSELDELLEGHEEPLIKQIVMIDCNLVSGQK